MMNKSPETLLAEREKRINDAVQLKIPDRVPIRCLSGFFPPKYVGVSVRDAMYDVEKAIMSAEKYLVDFEPDMIDNPFSNKFIGEILETLEYKQLKWSGYNMDIDASYQFLEADPMKADEYDEFIFDPTDFILRKFWPRVFGALKGFENLPPLHDILCYYMGITKFASFGSDDVIKALETLTKAAKSVQKMLKGAGRFTQRSKELGFPAMYGAGTQAPFDTLSDFMRGTQGAMMDMFRHPDKMIEATEKLLPIMVNMGLAAKERGTPRVFIPLHKGLDGFMSNEQFKRFYWPTLKKMIERFVEEDIVPTVLWEGDVTSKLELIGDIPRGKVVYHFEKTSLFKAKEILGDQVCLEGNVPITLLKTGIADDIKKYCKRLIDVVGKNGGFIMNTSTVLDDATPENLKTMFDFTKEYGVYR